MITLPSITERRQSIYTPVIMKKRRIMRTSRTRMTFTQPTTTKRL